MFTGCSFEVIYACQVSHLAFSYVRRATIGSAWLHKTQSSLRHCHENYSSAENGIRAHGKKVGKKCHWSGGIIGIFYVRHLLSIYLVEWSSIRETRVPNLVHRLDSLYIVLDPWSCHHRLHRAPPNTVLELLCYSPVASCPKLSCESALAT